MASPPAAPPSQRPSLATGASRGPTHSTKAQPRTSTTSSASQKPSTGKKGPAAKKPPPKKPSEIMVEVGDLEKMHEGEVIGSANWSVKTRRVLYKILVGLALLIPLAPSIVLIVFLQQHPFFGGEFYKLVTRNRSTTQVIVAIMVSILSYLNIFIFSNLFRAFEVKLSENKFFALLLDTFGAGDKEADDKKTDKNIDKVTDQAAKWWAKGYGLKSLAVGLLAFGLFSAPHLVWTGALTPVQTAKYIPFGQTTYNTYVPIYAQQTASNWANNSKHLPTDCLTGFNNSALFLGCPVTAQSGSLFNVMAGASYQSLNKSDYGYLSLAQHSKDENSAYLYFGRSYGVGSSIGVAKNRTAQYPSELEVYAFNETGYKTTVTCERNDSSAWTLEQVQGSNITGVPSLFRAVGRFNNSDWSEGSSNDTSISAVAAQSIDDVVIWGVKSTSLGQQGNAQGYEHVLTIAAGANYSSFDKIQCRINFKPTRFSVAAAINSTLIDVEPLDDTPVSFDSDGGLALTVAAQLAFLGSLQQSPYTSQLGDALVVNKVAREDVDNIDRGNAPDELLQDLNTVADSVAAAADGILLYVATSQYYLAATNASDHTPADITVGAIQLGDDPYIYIVILVTSLLVVAVVAKEIYLAVTDRRTFYTTNEQWAAQIREKLDKKNAKATRKTTVVETAVLKGDSPSL